MEKHSDNQLVQMLRRKYGDHSKAARALGYGDPSTYRKARKKGLPKWRKEKAMQLLGLNSTASTIKN